jgi:hypothetical protein
VSVILDALRRHRKRDEDADPHTGAAPRQVPAGLGLGGSSPPATSGARPARTRILGLGLLLVIGLGVWAAIQVARTLITTYSAPAQSSASLPPDRGAPSSASPATPPVAPVPPPPASVASGGPMTSAAPMTSSPTSEPASPEPRGDRSQRRQASTVVLRSSSRQSANAPRQDPGPEQPEPAPQTPEPKAQSPEPSLPSADVNHFERAVRYHSLGDYDEALKH